MTKIIVLFIFLIAFIELSVCRIGYNTKKSCDKTDVIQFKEKTKSHRMVEILFANNTINDCYIIGDLSFAERVASKQLCRPKTLYVDRQTLTKWALKCSEWLLSQKERGLLQQYSDEDFPDEYNNKIDRNFFEGFLIYPGTKWCGAGDIAEDYEDLGTERETDMCCRTHDHCFDQIHKGDTKYGLKNKAIHTKCHCECDHQFRQCLQSVDKSVSKTIAKLFFSLIQIQCFKEDHPIVDCLEYRGIPFFWSSCQKYSLDYTKPTIHQFFDAIFVD